MDETAGLFKLSYPIWTVVWDGKKIRKRADTDLQQQMDMMCELGIGEVMTTGYHLEEDSDFDPEHETRHVGEMLRRRGLRANQHHSHVATFAEPGSDQGRVLEHFKRCLEWTANLTAPAMVIHLGKPFGRFPAGGDEQELERLQRRYSLDAIVKLTMENLHLAGEYAARCGVRICVENLPYGISTWGKLPEVVEGADSEAVGYCLDSGHAWCEGWIRRAGFR